MLLFFHSSPGSPVASDFFPDEGPKCSLVALIPAPGEGYFSTVLPVSISI